MKKRLGRNLKKSAIVVFILLASILAIWGLSHMGGIITWLVKNWMGVTVGAAIAIIGRIVVDLLFDEEKK